jgi:hypothetical protein
MLGKALLELTNSVSIREITSIDRLADTTQDPFSDCAVRGPQIDERHGDVLHYPRFRGARAADSGVIAVRDRP